MGPVPDFMQLERLASVYSGLQHARHADPAFDLFRASPSQAAATATAGLVPASARVSSSSSSNSATSDRNNEAGYHQGGRPWSSPPLYAAHEGLASTMGPPPSAPVQSFQVGAAAPNSTLQYNQRYAPTHDSYSGPTAASSWGRESPGMATPASAGSPRDSRSPSSELGAGEADSSMSRKRDRFHWTEEMHTLFLAAVFDLGLASATAHKVFNQMRGDPALARELLQGDPKFQVSTIS